MKHPMKTYVFVGRDMEFLEPEHWPQNYQIVKFKDGEPISETIKRTNIQTPCNVILAAHGQKDGSFIWTNDKFSDHTEFFDALPNIGVKTISIHSCFGGSVQNHLAHAPYGAVVQSTVGPLHVGHGYTTDKLIAEAAYNQNPIDLYLESLDNFNPQQYKEYVQYWNNKTNNTLRTDPGEALPRLIGIGSPIDPVRIDMLEEVKNLSHSSQKNRVSKELWNRTTERVFRSFDPSNDISDRHQANTDVDRSERLKVWRQVLDVREKIESGKPLADINSIQGADEHRIAYALAAAHLQESGELDKKIAHAREPSYNLQVDLKIHEMEKKGWGHRIGNGDSKIDIEEILDTFKKHKMSIADCDPNRDGLITGKEISNALVKLPIVQKTGREL